jgi:hypothetical protein
MLSPLCEGDVVYSYVEARRRDASTVWGEERSDKAIWLLVGALTDIAASLRFSQ